MLSCNKCLLPETAEATSFDDTGSCSVCAQIEVRDTQIDWDARHAQMLELVAQYRDKGLYDCIVPYSGGKDSVFQLWYVPSGVWRTRERLLNGTQLGGSKDGGWVYTDPQKPGAKMDIPFSAQNIGGCNDVL